MNQTFRIDVHTHLAGSGCCNSGCWISPKFKRRYTFRLLKLLYGITDKQMHTTVDIDWAKMLSDVVAGSPIDYGVAFGFDGAYHEHDGHHIEAKSQMIIPAEWVFQVCREHRNLLPGPSINPHRADAMKRLEYCIDNGAVLIKWLPAAQGINATSASLKDFYRLLAEANIPVLMHMGGERTFATIRPEANDVTTMRPALDAGCKVICAHTATRIVGTSEPDQLPQLRAMLREYPNLWVDNSGMCNPGRFAHVPVLAKDELIAGRTLYGSDWPVPSNAFYYAMQLGVRATWQIEREKNLIARDIKTKSALGYPEATLTRASQVLANLSRWTRID